jgi:hypothetical protein
VNTYALDIKNVEGLVTMVGEAIHLGPNGELIIAGGEDNADALAIYSPEWWRAAWKTDE